jgi:glycosyltransferase involved in cell wall biosynthesis
MQASVPRTGGLHICTIVARNYLPAARVLTSTFLAHNPGGQVSVLVTDDIHGVVDADQEAFEVISPADLFDDSTELHRMAAIYEITEFATSMKPWLLEHLLDRGAESVLYLDPDIGVYDRLDELAGVAKDREIALIPHARAPFPRDGKMTSESAILAVGVYNLGFIGVGQSSRAFLAFWKERLRRECRNDPGNMRFVDQRWVDFVPGMFECEIVRDPRWNVAYWNLHEREVLWTGERYEVEGKQLGFFHFSGYSPSSRHILSRHQVERPRIKLSEHPSLVKIFSEYGDELEKSGFGSESPDIAGEYGLSRALNGVKLDRYVRKVYLEHLLAWESGDEPSPPPDPFDPSGAKELLEWLNSIAPSRIGPSRLTFYQATLYAHRPELHSEFPDSQGADFERFQNWLARQAEMGTVDPLLVPPRDLRTGGDAEASAFSQDQSAPTDPEAIWGRSNQRVSGITVVGYLDETHSIGELGRLATATVAASHVPFQAVTFESGDGLATFARAGTTESLARSDYDTNLVIVNADQFCVFADSAGPALSDRRYTIAQWAWELEEFPQRFQPAMELVDEVWAISEFTRRAISAVTDKPVFASQPPVIAPEISPEFDRSALGVPDGRFVFLFCFDFFSVVERKNPLGLIDAFRRAFPEGDGPEGRDLEGEDPEGEGPILLIKTVNGESKPMDLEMVRLASEGRSDVLVVDASLPAGQLGALMQTADCYVSLHRSEGFGLTMAESMILGKPVIATGYSGNLDFMTDENSFLVPHSWAVVPRGADPYPEGARWADPDLDAAASLMRKVFDDPDLARSVARRGQIDMLERHSPEMRSQFVRSRFDTIERTRIVGSARVGQNANGGEVDNPLSLSGMSELVRRGVRRARGQGLARHTADLDRAVKDLSSEVEGLRRIRNASVAKQSDQDLQLESAVREIGRRLGSLERRLETLEQTADRIEGGAGDRPDEGDIPHPE